MNDFDKGNTMNTNANNTVPQQIQDAKESLKKLPILGPAMWLYARDDLKKYTFIAEQDWLLLPPIILDQCKLYTRDEIPWAFCTWAFVSDEIDARFRNSIPKIAPHEWKSGTHPWLIDVVAPFGDRESIIEDARQTVFNGAAMSALLSQRDGTVVVRDYPAIA
jgi:cytolysin-activating lysine-acyltransferase